MSEREAIEEQIRQAMAGNLSAVTFSNTVFGQFTGLFARLGPTVEARREIVQSALWNAAQAHLRELERKEIARRRAGQSAA